MSKRKKSFPFFLWHRRLGLSALALTFVLAITGIILNHTEEFKLDETSIESEIILNWYGINPKGSPLNYNTDNIWISQWNQQLFFNGNSLLTHKERLQGVTKVNDIVAIALEKSVLLTDDNGEIIELVSVETKFPINKISTLNNKIALLDKQNNVYISNSDFTNWHKHNQQPSSWASPTNLSDDKIEILQKAFRGQGLNLERVILDLHSGRIFNAKWGVYIMDISAFAIILLGLSGVWVFWSRKLKMRKKKKSKKAH